MTERYACISPVANILEAPRQDARIGAHNSQILYGEHFMADSEAGEYMHGTLETDGYKGYVHRAHLQRSDAAASHFIDLPLTHAYPEPGFKTYPVMQLPFLAKINPVTDEMTNGFVRISGDLWIFSGHIKPISELNKSIQPVDTALKFIESPYLYGGRSALGIDCSGLVQLSLLRSGLACLRDSHQQENSLGHSIEHKDIERGDIVFFRGHVGIMVDRDNILNATARTMDVRMESLAALEEIYKGITAIKRL